MIEGFLIFQSVAEIIILVLGTIGNVLVVLVVARKQKMRTVTNYFILNLAISDLTVLISNIPVDLTTRFVKRWVFGKDTCKILKPLQTMGTIASILTLVAISLSRYHAIVYPFHQQMKLFHARIVLVLIWVISLAGITPYALACKYDPNKQDCIEDFTDIGMSTEAYTLTMFALQYVIPMIGMTYAYNRIGAELSNQQCRECGTTMDPEYRRDTKKVVKMLSIVVAVFAVLDLPIHIVWIWIDFFNGSKVVYYPYIQGLAIIMLYGNSFTNPLIYSICNEQFRTGFKDLFGWCLQPCSFLMKIPGLAKSDPERMFSRNDCLSVREENSIGDRQMLTIDNDQRETHKPKFERSDSVCSQRCTSRHWPKEILASFEPDKDEVVVYVSAV
ncbi:neuropeptide FF receptor 2-like [Dendronephthya gigantea]|uniref:neuropeptide FF receptor 2-like n=1 Tax=Dendronephthya gigantea TaxID=151771 RepID=UPI00106CAD18|nr:neuropeptide FF receptor 2-like [Dendronephthya gigantea]XP_028393037.1 neuropeptide FF receptor 2-like [Dendronephthya gigantea]XP_028393038.1 neuropeptide FF receptor 2-like [Dendronephthya gigantea]XP_028393039.1 neuropeptide FF receptor 2-like [Dendronephthya gigantea]XP_028393040.1 neuropeptide FF receptor 2-like [Dendronephthya gigantea]XP_028393041.1 neuropeptide FF receptor 2-like [Dendronephthya gigantea]XP_028393042.1 neuropeptide FF receptor 2-like [Dendronephthya gigantea]XP_0